jgi:hypothetical protein
VVDDACDLLAVAEGATRPDFRRRLGAGVSMRVLKWRPAMCLRSGSRLSVVGVWFLVDLLRATLLAIVDGGVLDDLLLVAGV